MNKKITSIVITIILVIFSFYYTNKSIDIAKHMDTIMRQIENSKEKYNIEPIDAIIKEDTIIPGIYGKEIDKNISYSKMKKYGKYNESLTTLKNVKPKITISNNYDKYIISGNKNKRQVSLIFNIDSKDNLDIILNYLNNEHIQAILLIPTDILDTYEDIIKDINNYELELSFKNINDITVSSYSNYLYNITNQYNKYCITKEKDNELLNVCKKHKLHTVIPNIILNTNIISTTKKEISNGSIVLVNINSNTKKELDYVIKYIENKGYTLTTLNNLLSEKID